MAKATTPVRVVFVISPAKGSGAAIEAASKPPSIGMCTILSVARRVN
jgi:hypothetical protein